MEDMERLDLSASIERIGLSGGHILVSDAKGVALFEQSRDLPNHTAALQTFLTWLKEQRSGDDLDAVGHRVVHGGSKYSEPQLISHELVAELRRLVPIDPLHLPQAIDSIEITSRIYPEIPQVACFDTAFHRHMPRVAQMYALPRHLWDEGVIRYGFHGLSYEYIMQELRRLDSAGARGRVVIAHLGNGASMAAVRDGIGIDTTMGFTPSGGLVMGTRTGDLDPGVLLYLLESQGMSPAAVNELVNRQSGLLGVSGISADMHDLLDSMERGTDSQSTLRGHGEDSPAVRAAEAVDLFCYQARKFVGALVAALGRLDTLVFTAGIGEHAAPVRERVCSGLEYLGIDLDQARNANHAAIISRDGSAVTVRVMKTDEDLMIARHTYRLIARKGGPRVSV